MFYCDVLVVCGFLNSHPVSRVRPVQDDLDEPEELGVGQRPRGRRGATVVPGAALVKDISAKVGQDRPDNREIGRNVKFWEDIGK